MERNTCHVCIKGKAHQEATRQEEKKKRERENTLDATAICSNRETGMVTINCVPFSLLSFPPLILVPSRAYGLPFPVFGLVRKTILLRLGFGWKRSSVSGSEGVICVCSHYSFPNIKSRDIFFLFFRITEKLSHLHNDARVGSDTRP